jgi:hypothetical protein
VRTSTSLCLRALLHAIAPQVQKFLLAVTFHALPMSVFHLI